MFKKLIIIAALLFSSVAFAQQNPPPPTASGCGTKGYLYSGTGGNGCDTPTGSGITSLSLPVNLFQTSPCTGPTCNMTYVNQLPYTLFRSPGGSFQQILFIQKTTDNQCAYSIVAVPPSVQTCALPGPSNQHDFILVKTGCYSPNGGQISSITDIQGDTFTPLNGTSCANVFYAKNIAGGSVTLSITFTSDGSPDPYTVAATEYSGADTTSPLDVNASTSSGGSCSSGILTLPSITTLLGGDLVIATVSERAPSGGPFTAIGHGVGYNSGTWSQSVRSGGSTTGMVFEEYVATTVAGTFVSTMTNACNGTPEYYGLIGLKPAAVPNALPYMGYIDWPMMTQQAFPNLGQFMPAGDGTGSTGISIQIGTPINASNVTTAYAGNDTASTLYPNVALTPLALHCWMYTSCHSTVASATVVPALLFTDEQGTAITMTGATATCTTAGTNDVSAQEWPIRINGNSTVYFKTTIANSPHYDVHVACELAGIK